ncbi:MAG: hypothetical protein ABSD38_06380 [Syntrophorhabdales bacterium]|jgi:hypothetical protein
MPLQVWLKARAFKPEVYRKASYGRLTDEIYKITPNGAGLVIGKQWSRRRVGNGQNVLNARGRGVFGCNIPAYPGRKYRDFSVGRHFTSGRFYRKPRVLRRNKQSLDREGEGNAAFREVEVYQLAGFEGGFLAAYTGRAARNSAMGFSHYLLYKGGHCG